jgi:hypothetical protein
VVERKTRPIFWWILGGVVAAYAIVVMRKPKALPPRFVALPGDVDRLTATDLRNGLPDAGKRYFDVIQRVAAETRLSPVLLAAIMDVESRFGDALTPPGPAGKGDGGHGHGLMQIDDRTHGTFLAQKMPDGTPKWANPYENVKYAANVYKTAFEYFRKNPVAGATVEVKAGGSTNKRGVPAGVYRDVRPLSESDARLAAIAAYNAGPFTILQTLSAGIPADTVTASSYRNGTLMPYLANVVAAVNDLASRAA